MKATPHLLRTLLLAAISALPLGIVEAADPAEAKTIGRVVRERPDLSNFLKLLDKTEIGSQLSEKTSIRRTVFAPTDGAFAKLPEDSLKTLLDPRNDDRLEEFGFHVLNRSLPPIGLETCASLVADPTGGAREALYGILHTTPSATCCGPSSNVRTAFRTAT